MFVDDRNMVYYIFYMTPTQAFKGLHSLCSTSYTLIPVAFCRVKILFSTYKY